MDTVRKPEVAVSAAEPINYAEWQTIGQEITARLKAITTNVNYVLDQEGLLDRDFDYDEIEMTQRRLLD